MMVMLFGGWRVSPSLAGDPAKVWIQAPSGEGGDFCAKEFELVAAAGALCGDMAGAIKRFFWENF